MSLPSSIVVNAGNPVAPVAPVVPSPPSGPSRRSGPRPRCSRRQPRSARTPRSALPARPSSASPRPPPRALVVLEGAKHLSSPGSGPSLNFPPRIHVRSRPNRPDPSPTLDPIQTEQRPGFERLAVGGEPARPLETVGGREPAQRASHQGACDSPIARSPQDQLGGVPALDGKRPGRDAVLGLVVLDESPRRARWTSTRSRRSRARKLPRPPIRRPTRSRDRGADHRR